MSLEDVICTTEWLLEAILTDNVAVINFSQDEVVEITPELTEKELDPEKEEPAPGRSGCLRSSAPGRTRKKKMVRKHGLRTLDMIEGGTCYSNESAPEFVEDGCLLLGKTRFKFF